MKVQGRYPHVDRIREQNTFRRCKPQYQRMLDRVKWEVHSHNDSDVVKDIDILDDMEQQILQENVERLYDEAMEFEARDRLQAEQQYMETPGFVLDCHAEYEACVNGAHYLRLIEDAERLRREQQETPTPPLYAESMDFEARKRE